MTQKITLDYLYATQNCSSYFGKTGINYMKINT